jgi:hypothetical protein
MRAASLGQPTAERNPASINRGWSASELVAMAKVQDELTGRMITPPVASAAIPQINACVVAFMPGWAPDLVRWARLATNRRAVSPA